jgi:hypothetical protein
MESRLNASRKLDIDINLLLRGVQLRRRWPSAVFGVNRIAAREFGWWNLVEQSTSDRGIVVDRVNELPFRIDLRLYRKRRNERDR